MLALRRRRRGRDERRARPPRDLRLAGRGARGRSARSWPARRRPSCGTGPTSLALRGDAPDVAFDVADAGARRRRLALRRGAGTRVRLRVPGRPQRAQRRRRARGLRAGRRRPARPPPRRWRTSPAPGRRFQRLGDDARAARASSTTTPTTRPRSRPRIDAARTLAPAPGRRGLPAAPVLAHAAARARVRRRAGAAPTSPPCSTSTRRASAPRTSPASSGLLVAEAAADAARRAPGAVAADLRRRRAGPARAAARRATCAWSSGAGDVDELGRRLVATG